MFGDRGILNDFSRSGEMSIGECSLPCDNFLLPLLPLLIFDGRRVREVAREGGTDSSAWRVVCGDRKFAASASSDPLQIARPRTCECTKS